MTDTPRRCVTCRQGTTLGAPRFLTVATGIEQPLSWLALIPLIGRLIVEESNLVEIVSQTRVLAGLEGFADQFRAQVDAAGAPASEHSVHFCVALGFQAAIGLPAGSIVFERPVSGRSARTDLWVGPEPGTFIEVKYNRPIPSGRSRPFTQLYGLLLADFNKLGRTTDAGNRLVILVADQVSSTHLQRSGGGVLPRAVGQSATVSAPTIASLAQTAQIAAMTHGEWLTELRIELIWLRRVTTWALFCWAVEQASSGIVRA